MFPNKLHFSLVLVLRLSTIFTDVFTFFHIKLSSRQCSTSDSVCNICHTHCNEQNNLQVQQNMNDQTISPIQNGVTTSPTACSGSQGAVAQLDDTGRCMSGNIPHPEGCLWKNNNNCCCNKQKLDIPFKSTFFSNSICFMAKYEPVFCCCFSTGTLQGDECSRTCLCQYHPTAQLHLGFLRKM